MGRWAETLSPSFFRFKFFRGLRNAIRSNSIRAFRAECLFFVLPPVQAKQLEIVHVETLLVANLMLSTAMELWQVLMVFLVNLAMEASQIFHCLLVSRYLRVFVSKYSCVSLYSGEMKCFKIIWLDHFRSMIYIYIHIYYMDVYGLYGILYMNVIYLFLHNLFETWDRRADRRPPIPQLEPLWGVKVKQRKWEAMSWNTSLGLVKVMSLNLPKKMTFLQWLSCSLPGRMPKGISKVLIWFGKSEMELKGWQREILLFTLVFKWSSQQC